MSFPVAGTLMIEPTESEPQGGARPLLRRDDRHPRGDPRDRGGPDADRADNPLKNAPHTVRAVTADRVDAPLHARAGRVPRGLGCATHKFWPAVGRIDNAYGDRNLVCACPPMEEYH